MKNKRRDVTFFSGCQVVEHAIDQKNSLHDFYKQVLKKPGLPFGLTKMTLEGMALFRTRTASFSHTKTEGFGPRRLPNMRGPYLNLAWQAKHACGANKKIFLRHQDKFRGIEDIFAAFGSVMAFAKCFNVRCDIAIIAGQVIKVGPLVNMAPN